MDAKASDSRLEAFFSPSLLSSTLPDPGRSPAHLDVTPASFRVSAPPCLWLPLVFCTLLSCSNPPVAPQTESHLLVMEFKTLHTGAWPTLPLCPQRLPYSPTINLHFHTSSVRKAPWAQNQQVYILDLPFCCRLTFYTQLPFSGPLSLSWTSGLGKMTSQGLSSLKAL